MEQERLSVAVPTPEDWAEWRDVRRRALADAPDAFGSSLAREAEFTEQDWRHRLAGGRAVLVRVGTRTVGMGGCTEERPGAWSVVGMWVSPEVRGLGVGARVLEQVLARVPYTAEVSLWVADGNVAALRLYERAGFVATMEREPIRPGASLWKQRMVLTR